MSSVLLPQVGFVHDGLRLIDFDPVGGVILGHRSGAGAIEPVLMAREPAGCYAFGLELHGAAQGFAPTNGEKLSFPLAEPDGTGPSSRRFDLTGLFLNPENGQWIPGKPLSRQLCAADRRSCAGDRHFQFGRWYSFRMTKDYSGDEKLCAEVSYGVPEGFINWHQATYLSPSEKRDSQLLTIEIGHRDFLAHLLGADEEVLGEGLAFSRDDLDWILKVVGVLYASAPEVLADGFEVATQYNHPPAYHVAFDGEGRPRWRTVSGLDIPFEAVMLAGRDFYIGSSLKTKVPGLGGERSVLGVDLVYDSISHLSHLAIFERRVEGTDLTPNPGIVHLLTRARQRLDVELVAFDRLDPETQAAELRRLDETYPPVSYEVSVIR